jgi:hypothetical protein
MRANSVLINLRRLYKITEIIFICSKASNPCDLVVEWTSGHKSVYHCFNSLHHQPPPLASKRRLRVREGDSKESTLPS